MPLLTSEVNSGTGAQYSASYTYNNLNRLTSSPLGSYTYGDSAHADAATAIGSGNSAWTASYDASGNMTCRAASGATTCAGTSSTGAQLAYDNQGQLAQWLSAPTTPTSSASYLYDGEGHRIQQVTTTSGTTTTTSYLGSLEEVSTDGTTTTTTAYYGGLALSVNGALSYTLSDGLGSVSASVNASTGVVSATQLYGPYGAVREQSGALPTSYGYTHQRSDAVSGLDYYNARYYDPLAGQFTSADSILPKQGATPDPSQLNRYAYVTGNPESKSDPSGHSYVLGHTGDDEYAWVTPHNNKYPNTRSKFVQVGPPRQRFHYSDPDYRPGEFEDGLVLFQYFGITDPATGRRNGPSLYAVGAEQGGKLFGTTADYVVGYEVPGLEMDVPLPGFEGPGIQLKSLAGLTPIDLYSPKADTNPGKISAEAVTKGKKAAIVAIDITGNQYLSGDVTAQVALAQRITGFQPNARKGTSVMRVIFIDSGEVSFDSDPLYGPSPGGGEIA